MKIMVSIISVLGIILCGTVTSVNHVWAQDYYSIPSWTKEISDYWSHGQLSNTESVNAFEYLEDKKILVVPGLTFDQTVSFDKKMALTKTLSTFLWNESSQSTDIDAGAAKIIQQPI